MGVVFINQGFIWDTIFHTSQPHWPHTCEALKLIACMNICILKNRYECRIHV